MASNVTKNKTIVGFYYEETETGIFKCKACPTARKSRKQAPGTGYTNLMNHIFQEHPNYLKEMREAANTHHLTPVFRATKKAQNIYSWLEWIIMENREFKFPEKEFIRKNTKLEPVTDDQIRK